MSEGLNHKIELKIGLCNTETELLKKYKELFDIVIENDGPLTRVNDLLRVLSS